MYITYHTFMWMISNISGKGELSERFIQGMFVAPLGRKLLAHSNRGVAYSRPLVATAVGGIPEQVEDGVTGLMVVVPPGMLR